MNDLIDVNYLSGSAWIFSDEGKISFELYVFDDPEDARTGVENAKGVIVAEFPDAKYEYSLETEPSFVKSITRRGAMMSWTRTGYFFSAYAPGGEEDLDRFMKAFPY